MAATRNLQIDGRRLWESLMEMAKIGATPKGGVCRLALTDLDQRGRDLFIRWCREAGLAVTVDRIGNIFARRPGEDDSRPAVATGSHLDTQPTGGKFDGIFGVLAGIEVVRTLNDHGVRTRAPIELVVWTNEEGSRFAPSMMGSGVFAGAFALADILRRSDRDGRTVGEELARIGYAGDAPVGGRRIGAFFETHIEQGPVLEERKKTIGVVTGAQGLRWYDVAVEGRESHAGTTPMDRRQDALVGAARMVEAIHRLGVSHAPHGRTTVGVIEVKPASRNTIPGHVAFTVDMRHPEAATLDRMDAALRESCERVAADLGIRAKVEEVSYSPPVAFDPRLQDAVRRAAESAGYSQMDIISGAGHDSCYMARVAPTAMIFVPCAGGLSHNEEEAATPDDLAAGCTVLLHAMIGQAG